MSKKPIIKIARPGYDIRDIINDKDYSYTSDRVTPKICQYINTTDAFKNSIHGLGYASQFWLIRNIDGSKYAHWIQDYTMTDDIRNYPVTGGANDYNSFYAQKASGPTYTDTGLCGFMMIDALYDQEGNDIKPYRKEKKTVAKTGFNAKTGKPKDMKIDSRFDTLKIYRTGKITISAPSETISADKTYSGSYTHSLGYVPFYAPFCPYKNNLAQVYYPSSVPSTVIVNDFEGSSLFFRGTSVPAGNQDVNVWVTSSTFNVDYIRRPSGSTSYSARTIECYYTIFVNRVDEDDNFIPITNP